MALSGHGKGGRGNGTHGPWHEQGLGRDWGGQLTPSPQTTFAHTQVVAKLKGSTSSSAQIAPKLSRTSSWRHMDQCIVGEGTSSIGAVGEGSGLGLGQINGIMSEIGLGKELGLGHWSEEKRKGCKITS